MIENKEAGQSCEPERARARDEGMFEDMEVKCGEYDPECVSCCGGSLVVA